MSYAPSECMCTNGIVPLNHCEATQKFEPLSAIRPIMRVGMAIRVFSMLFFNKWKMFPQTSISLWVKRSYRNLVLGADGVVRLMTGYRLWIITYAKALIYGENGIVFMDDFFGVPPSICTISSVNPNLSSYWIEIG